MNSKRVGKEHCNQAKGTRPERNVSLPVVASSRPRVRASRTSKWRARVLVAVHVIMICHIAQWWWTGRTLSPVEPSEAMYTLNHGHLNAGFIFFGAALLATLVLGRFVCGWGCHFVAYQDLCAWMLKRVGIKPKALRSRLLVFAPLALALYMFVWPSVYRWWVGQSPPALTNHLLKEDFWATFPGPVVAVATILFAGFAIVYFLGAKGFCTYACPYGGFFGLADQVAPGRILVTDACEHCGHCTSVCTSNVRVHEEVAMYGMVVDPGCMKCMDCVSVCPNDALYFGFGRPALVASAKAPRRPRSFDFSIGEEVWMVIVGVASLLAFRGLYGQIPLLLAMGMAAVTAYLFMKLVRLVRVSNVRFQNLQLKRGGRVTRSGVLFAAAVVALAAFAGHSGAVQFQVWRGRALLRAVHVGDEVWSEADRWWEGVSDQKRSQVDAAIARLERADRWGLRATDTVLSDLVWLYVARQRLDDAESTLRRLVELRPGAADPHHGLGRLLRRKNRLAAAEREYRRALALDPAHNSARHDLYSLMLGAGRMDDAVVVVREGLTVGPHETAWVLELVNGLFTSGQYRAARAVLEELVARRADLARGHWLLGVALMQTGEASSGLEHLQEAIHLDPDLGEAHYDLAMSLLERSETRRAMVHLQRAAELNPSSAIVHYNLAVASFMLGGLNEAVGHARESIRLNPGDPDAHAFLAMVLDQLGDPAGAQEASDSASPLRVRP